MSAYLLLHTDAYSLLNTYSPYNTRPNDIELDYHVPAHFTMS